MNAGCNFEHTVTPLHAISVADFGKTYFVINILIAQVRRMGFSESSQNFKAKKSILCQFELLFSHCIKLSRAGLVFF